jgi:hypothetical protein
VRNYRKLRSIKLPDFDALKKATGFIRGKPRRRNLQDIGPITRDLVVKLRSKLRSLRDRCAREIGRLRSNLAGLRDQAPFDRLVRLGSGLYKRVADLTRAAYQKLAPLRELPSHVVGTKSKNPVEDESLNLGPTPEATQAAEDPERARHQGDAAVAGNP